MPRTVFRAWGAIPPCSSRCFPALRRGREQAGALVLPGKVIAVCPLGDPYTYKANATAAAGARFEQIVDRLRPYLEAHGVDDRTGDEVESVWRWPSDPRSRPDHEPRAPRRRRRVAPAAGHAGACRRAAGTL